MTSLRVCNNALLWASRWRLVVVASGASFILSAIGIAIGCPVALPICLALINATARAQFWRVSSRHTQACLVYWRRTALSGERRMSTMASSTNAGAGFEILIDRMRRAGMLNLNQETYANLQRIQDEDTGKT